MEKIFVTYKIPEIGLKLLSKFNVEVNEEDRTLSKKEIIERAQDATALVTLLSDNIDAEIINALPRLKIIANYAVGFNNIDIEAAKAKGVIVTNTPDILTDASADLAMALLLATARRIVEADKFVRKGLFEGWKPELFLGIELNGKTLGIIGLGRIGKAVAKRAQAFGMKVIYHNRRPLTSEEEKNLDVEYRSLEQLLKESDFISLHVPLTSETYHLLSRSKLKLMKPSAVLINTSRGAVVDEEALIEFLQQGKIAAAGLDVYENEPEVPYALKELDNVVLLPHIGSATVETRNNMAVLVAKNVLAVLEGKKPLTPVY
ncbi:MULTISPECIES: 2-hydroxyacid dehydrogenase [Kosmotoga]|uniref:D-isomer specific 2-hydroxyacid dehydrogenase NAD-binding n=1 Tax=Kosmotoga olearia (strain ATCC BAA-1733 / DSM 21960 / TBF 19.5.1) TaxID=521045 RepID=C5CGK9_KOSOT|nr:MULTISPECIES: D-glycerate dehydrogenase [Kosmotoga]ACR79591.1 D-isomer specific 2-hydroxyacid dehydrogenase NAD-binding [Kosmotoga olearia TBF 19.5.1]MDI3524433.1 glyoxylate reductase [Kosmotoga sp.]MDK2954246.1 glyoxylate reductase [Kosmotoga sp.]